MTTERRDPVMDGFDLGEKVLEIVGIDVNKVSVGEITIKIKPTEPVVIIVECFSPNGEGDGFVKELSGYELAKKRETVG